MPCEMQQGCFFKKTKNNTVMETGRYWAIMKSGRKFMVEEWDSNYVQWGDIDPATKTLHKVKVKPVEQINEHYTLIKKENGFKNICFLAAGTSALGYIDALDSSGLERIVCSEITYEK
jgi:hypothetical protein